MLGKVPVIPYFCMAYQKTALNLCFSNWEVPKIKAYQRFSKTQWSGILVIITDYFLILRSLISINRI